MQEQTYITCLINKNGITIDFQRWFYKKLRTCINNTIAHYRSCFSFLYHDTLKNTEKIIIYKTEPQTNGIDKEIKMWEVSIDEFIEELRLHKEFNEYDEKRLLEMIRLKNQKFCRPYDLAI